MEEKTVLALDAALITTGWAVTRQPGDQIITWGSWTIAGAHSSPVTSQVYQVRWTSWFINLQQVIDQALPARVTHIFIESPWLWIGAKMRERKVSTARLLAVGGCNALTYALAGLRGLTCVPVEPNKIRTSFLGNACLTVDLLETAAGRYGTSAQGKQQVERIKGNVAAAVFLKTGQWPPTLDVADAAAIGLVAADLLRLDRMEEIEAKW